MKLKRLKGLLICSGLLVVIFGMTHVAQADSILGQIGFFGAWTPMDSNGISTVGDATSVDVLGAVVSSSSGTFADNGVSAGDLASYNDFTFNPSTPATPLWSVGGFAFDLQSISIVSQTANSLSLTGSGTVYGNGYTPSGFDWNFNGAGLTYGIALFANGGGTTPPTSLPEPSTLLLMGTGLAGVALIARRRKKAVE